VVNTGELNVTTTDTTGDNYTLLADYVPDALRVNPAPPSPLTVLSADQYVSKANMQNQQQYARILAYGVAADNATVQWTYDSPPVWPLIVGATWNFTKHTSDAMGIVNITVPRQGKVLGVESVTVPAGTFSCLHIAEYDNDPLSPTYGAITYEHWFSLDVGSDVKMIDRETYMGQETRELTSTTYVPPINTYTLTLNAVNGTIGASPLPVGGVYEQGTVVTLTANADSGYHFTNWSGDAGTGTISPVTITMDADKTVTANFAANTVVATYTVRARVKGGHGKVSPKSQKVKSGGTASISMTPAAGYSIASITDNGVAQPINNPYVTASVTAKHTVVVTFARSKTPKLNMLWWLPTCKVRR
jgi:uncharacterized repeat protein (TIGR02543 family)